MSNNQVLEVQLQTSKLCCMTTITIMLAPCNMNMFIDIFYGMYVIIFQQDNACYITGDLNFQLVKHIWIW